MVASQHIEDDEIQRRVLEETLKEVAAAHPDQESECCVICLEAVSDPCEALPCGHHNFDYLCASSWLFIHPSCPLCKVTVTGILHGAPKVADRPATAIPGPLAKPSIRSGMVREPEGSIPRFGRIPRPQQRPRTVLGTRTAGSDIQARREVYANRRYSMHVGSNRVSQYQELTPLTFCADGNLVSRARMFIRRELQVFSFLSSEELSNDRPHSVTATTTGNALPGTATRRRANNAEFLLEYIIAILKSVDIMGSVGTARDMLADFLGGENARQFLHELRAWLRSPFTKLEDWDRAVQYGPSEPRQEADEQQQQRMPGDSSNGRSSGGLRRDKGDYYRPRGNRIRPGGRPARNSVRHEPYRRTQRHGVERHGRLR